MARAHHVSITGGVIVCLLITQWNALLFASQAADASDTQAFASSPTSANPIFEQPAGSTPVLSVSEPQKQRAPFTFDASRMAADPLLGLVAPGARPTL